MTKVTEAVRSAVLSDSNLSNKELQQKYNLSRSTIQRILSTNKEEEEVTQTVTVPEINLTDRANNYFNTVKEEPLKIIERPIEDNKVLERLFAGLEEEPKQIAPIVEVPKVDRKSLIAKILVNVDTFPALFPFAADKTKFLVELGQYSVHDLEGLLENMETTRSTTNFSAQFKNIFFVVSRATETLGGLVKLKTTGLTDALLQQQQELDYIFKEIAIQYSDNFKVSLRPEVRLALLFGFTVLQVDSTNRIKERIKPKAAPEITTKYNDL